jgi:hypothetical protein
MQENGEPRSKFREILEEIGDSREAREVVAVINGQGLALDELYRFVIWIAHEWKLSRYCTLATFRFAYNAASPADAAMIVADALTAVSQIYINLPHHE